jgi:ABC-type uncharacterized transport system permease subunit
MRNNREISSDLERLKLSFAEMKDYFDFLSDATDKLDSKLLSLFSSLSIILTLFGTIGIDFSNKMHWIDICLLVLLIFIFLLFCLIIYLGLIPKKYSYPFDGTLEGIENNFLNKETLSDIYEQMIANYAHQLSLHSDVNYSKSINLKFAYVLYLFELVVIIIMALFS